MNLSTMYLIYCIFNMYLKFPHINVHSFPFIFICIYFLHLVYRPGIVKRRYTRFPLSLVEQSCISLYLDADWLSRRFIEPGILSSRRMGLYILCTWSNKVSLVLLAVSFRPHSSTLVTPELTRPLTVPDFPPCLQTTTPPPPQLHLL